MLAAECVDMQSIGLFLSVALKGCVCGKTANRFRTEIMNEKGTHIVPIHVRGNHWALQVCTLCCRFVLTYLWAVKYR